MIENQLDRRAQSEKETIAGETKMREREGEKASGSARGPRGAFACHR